MAANGNSKATSQATLGKIPVPFHQHDDWLLPAAKSDANAQFASKVVDVARGCRVIASILCSHLADLNAITASGDESIRPLLSESDTEALARLAVQSLRDLYQLSEERVDAINDAAETGDRA